MTENRLEILKAKTRCVQGTCVIPIGGPVLSKSSGCSQPRSHTGPAQARILESNSDYAVIEIVCSCGQKNHIQCNYGNVARARTQSGEKNDA